MKIGNLDIQENQSLRTYHSFGIEVNAKFFIELKSIDDIENLVQNISQIPQPIYYLGGGANSLFTDDFKGTVVHIANKGISLIEENEEHILLSVQAGEDWDEFVQFCVENEYYGIENLTAIPGQVGTAPIQNIGAYGVEMKDHFVELEGFHWETGEIRTWKYEDCQFGYRNSIFKNKLKGKAVILSVTFRLDKNPVLETGYGAIQEEIKQMGVEQLSIEAIRDAVISIRKRKLPDPEEIGNAGSFFKNPVISERQFLSLKKTYPKIVSYQLPDGSHKLAAGWLIDRAAWKGKRFGNAGVHENQALVLVNYGNANGNEIIQIASQIEQSVKEMFGVDLEREVNIIK